MKNMQQYHSWMGRTGMKIMVKGEVKRAKCIQNTSYEMLKEINKNMHKETSQSFLP